MLHPCIIMCVLILQLSLNAQILQETNFTRYTKMDGLSNNYITSIVQDSSGYIWIGTNKGLNRFDGKFFTNYFKQTEHSPIPENLIKYLNVENGIEITGTTVAGAFSYNTVTQKKIFFIVPSDSVIHFWANQAWQILKDEKGNYIVSTKTGLYVFNSTGEIISRYDYYKTSDAGKTELWFGNWLNRLDNGLIFQENNHAGSTYDPVSGKIDSLYSAKTKKITGLINGKTGDNRLSFPGKKNEIFYPNFEKHSFDIYNLLTGEIISSAIPSAFLTDIDWYSKLFYINDSSIAITGKVGGFYLFHYNASQKKIYGGEEKYFASKYCTALFKDNEGRLWIGTNDGLYMQNVLNPFFAVTDLSLQLPSIIHSGIQSVYIADHKLFVGLRNEGGLLLLDNVSKNIEKQFKFEKAGSGGNTINFILSHSPDTLWLGTGRGIIWFNVHNYSYGRLNFPGQPVWMDQSRTRNYLVDSKGNTWLSFGELNSVVLFIEAEHKFCDLSQSPLLKITFCFSMVEDKSGNIWLAGDGICRWNRNKNVIDTLIPYPKASSSLFNYMNLLDCDENNTLWINGFDNEIIQYDCNNNEMHLRVPENSSMDGYTVTNSQIIDDNIWLGMVNGISAVNIKNFSTRQFNYADGLPSASPTSHRKGSFYNVSENRFYFGAGRYLISFIPDVNISKTTLPRFSIEASGLNESLTNEINLPYSQKDLELRLNAINFTDPEENRFAYRFLNEDDSSWRNLYTKTIVLGKLSPGKHAIQVKLYSVNNRWPSQFRTIHITVHPPFWKKSWFMLLFIIFIAATLYILYRRRINQIKQKANVDRLLAQTEMKALHAQMNPHFIFNCLNSIREMILNNENSQASVYLSKFARLIRITLNHSSKSFVTLKETIDYLERYIEMEQIRNNNFHCVIATDEELLTENILLPPMLIQPFIENAIWHGAIPDKQMDIKVQFSKNNDKLVCTIDDDGIGINESLLQKHKARDSQSFGFSNTKQRITLLNEKYHLNCSVTIEDKAALVGQNGHGTIVTLYLPVKYYEI